MKKIILKAGYFIYLFCAVLGCLMFISCLLVAYINIKDKKISIPEHSALVIDFSQKFPETKSDSMLAEVLEEENMSLYDLIMAIDMASIDNRIDGLVAYIDTTTLDISQIQDISRAIKRFHKKTYVFSQGFGPLGQGNKEYYLASFFDEIYMQPQTSLGLNGISIEVPFAKNLLEKIGVDTEFYTRYEYKTAMSSFTDNKMSKAYKDELSSLANSLMNEIKTDITSNRKLNEDIETIINKAPIFAEEAKELNLIDDILYLPQLEDKLKEENGIKNFVNINDYSMQLRPNKGNLPTIAILNIDGIIDTGESFSELDGEIIVGSKSVLKDIQDISQLDNLKALLVRINSPGGSYHAADEIYFALKKLKHDKNIPIIISQSSYAASGGYFISLAGDYIIAEPTTITGSIGVLGGKFIFENLWKKLNISWENIKTNTNSDILSPNKRFSAQEAKIFNASLDNIYKDFTDKVKQNRPLKQPIDKIARGRVWTGRQALELGLIDALGGINDALSKTINKQPTEPISIVSYPKALTFSERISKLLSDNNIFTKKILSKSNVDIRHLKLFKRMQYDTVLPLFNINM